MQPTLHDTNVEVICNSPTCTATCTSPCVAHTVQVNRLKPRLPLTHGRVAWSSRELSPCVSAHRTWRKETGAWLGKGRGVWLGIRDRGVARHRERGMARQRERGVARHQREGHG